MPQPNHTLPPYVIQLALTVMQERTVSLRRAIDRIALYAPLKDREISVKSSWLLNSSYSFVTFVRLMCVTFGYGMQSIGL